MMPHTKFSWVYFLKSKDECFAKFKEWKKMVENIFEKSVKILRTDNGGEYLSNDLKGFLNYLVSNMKERFLKHRNRML